MTKKQVIIICSLATILLVSSVLLLLIINKETSPKISNLEIKNDTIASQNEAAVKQNLEGNSQQLIVTSQPETINENITNSQSGLSARIIRMSKYSYKNDPDMVSYEQRLEVVTREGKVYAIEHFIPKYSGSITALKFSPNGQYLYYTVLGYEAEIPHLIDTNSLKNVLPQEIIVARKVNNDPEIVWTDVGTRMALHSYYSYMGGGGSDGVYVSLTGNPEDLVNIFPFYMMSKVNTDIQKVENLKITEASATFDAISEKGAVVKYNYDFANNKLSVIK